MKAKGGVLEVDADVLPINANDKAERAVVLEYMDMTDTEKWGPQARTDANGAFFNLHHTTGPDDPLVELVKKFVPKVQWRGSTMWERPWERPQTWGIYGLSERAFKEFRKLLRERKIDLKIVGKQVFAVDPREKPLTMPVQRAASNVEFYIPLDFQETNVTKEDEDGGFELINLKESVEEILGDVDAKYVRANNRKNIPAHYIIEYAKLNDDMVEKFQAIPGLNTTNIEALRDKISDELKDRFARPKWAKSVELTIPNKFRFGQFRVDAPNYLASGGDLKPAKLYPYQEEGVRFLLGDTMRILGDDRGLGKTVQSIVAADTLRDAKFPDQPVLVITPARLVNNFFDQIHTFSKHTTTDIAGNTINAVYVLDDKGPKSLGELLEKNKHWKRSYRKQQDGTYPPPKVAFIPHWAKWIIAPFTGARILTTLWKKTGVIPEKGEELDKLKEDGMLDILDDIPDGNLRPNAIAKAYVASRLDGLQPYERMKWNPNHPKTGPAIGTKYKTVRKIPKSVADPETGMELPLAPEYVVSWTVNTTKDHDTGLREKRGDFKKIAEYLKPSETDLEMYLAPLLGAHLLRYFYEESLSRTLVMGRTWDLAIFDEAHAYKTAGGGQTPASGTYLFARELMKHVRNAWFLTGTPIANKIIDLWSLFHLTSHELGVGENYNRFGEMYAGGGPKYVGLENLDELRNRSSNVLLWRYKDDVAGIPVQQLYKKVLEMPDTVRTSIGIDWMETNAQGMQVPATVALKSWDMYEYGGRRTTMGARRKQILGELAMWKAPFTIEEALNAVEEGHKVLVFTTYSDQNVPVVPLMTDIVDEYLARPDTKKFKYVVTIGSVSKQAMDQRVKQFTYDKDTKLLIGNIKTAGTGLNLQAATYSIFSDISDSPAEHEQAEDRTRRINQFKCTEVVYMVADAVEDERIWDKLWDRREHIEQAQEGRDDPDAYQRDTLVARIRQMHPRVEYPSPEFDAILKQMKAWEDEEDDEWKDK